jgi:hypothetical protein
MRRLPDVISDFDGLISGLVRRRLVFTALDPRWELEQMVAALVGQTDITPFQP